MSELQDEHSARHAYDAERPEFLYKYCPPERVDILENLKVRFSQPAVFNDIFECLPGTENQTDFNRARRHLISTMVATLIENPHWDRKARRAFERDELKKFEKWEKKESEKGWHQRLCEEVQIRISGMTGVLCLSAKWDNILMWSHYASEHRGFVIEFRGNDSFFDLGLQKVRYSNQRPLLKNKPDGWNGGGAELFVTKSTDWAYEEEYRKSMSFGKKSRLPDGCTFVEFPKLGEIDPNNWPLYLVDVPPTAISKVICGWRAKSETKARIARALQNPALKNVARAAVHPHRYMFRMEQAVMKG